MTANEVIKEGVVGPKRLSRMACVLQTGNDDSLSVLLPCRLSGYTLKVWVIVHLAANGGIQNPKHFRFRHFGAKNASDLFLHLSVVTP